MSQLSFVPKHWVVAFMERAQAIQTASWVPLLSGPSGSCQSHGHCSSNEPRMGRVKALADVSLWRRGNVHTKSSEAQKFGFLFLRIAEHKSHSGYHSISVKKALVNIFIVLTFTSNVETSEEHDNNWWNYLIKARKGKKISMISIQWPINIFTII